jgi:hypothetical protein
MSFEEWVRLEAEDPELPIQAGGLRHLHLELLRAVGQLSEEASTAAETGPALCLIQVKED